MAPEGFRGRRKAGADAEVVGSPANGGERFADVVRGAPHDRRWTGDAPHEVEGEIVAAEVNTPRSHCHGDIRTIVDDDQRVGPRPASGQLDRQTDATDERRDGDECDDNMAGVVVGGGGVAKDGEVDGGEKSSGGGGGIGSPALAGGGSSSGQQQQMFPPSWVLVMGHKVR